MSTPSPEQRLAANLTARSLPADRSDQQQLTKSIQVTLAALREFCPAAEEAMVPATIVYDQKTYDKRRRSVPVSDCRVRAYKIDPLYMMYLQMALSTHVRKVIMTT